MDSSLPATELVWMTDRCIHCNRINVLSPYKGDEINPEEPDRLVCSYCGSEYAIDRSNILRDFSPMISPGALNNFLERFRRKSVD